MARPLPCESLPAASRWEPGTKVGPIAQYRQPATRGRAPAEAKACQESNLGEKRPESQQCNVSPNTNRPTRKKASRAHIVFDPLSTGRAHLSRPGRRSKQPLHGLVEFL